MPFVTTFSEAFEDAKNLSVSNSDILVIEMPSFSFYGGQTEKQVFINVRDSYEPYRSYIRTGLEYIVYVLGIVYLIKYVLNWGQTQANIEVEKSGQYMSWSRRK